MYAPSLTLYVRPRDGGTAAGALWSADGGAAGFVSGPRRASFLEFYLVAGPNGFTLPEEPLARFAGRALCESLYIKPQPLGPATLDSGPSIDCPATGPALYVTPVNSAPPQGPIKRTRDDMLQNGVWASYMDLVPRGGPLGPAVSAYYGLPIDPFVWRVMYVQSSMVYAAVQALWPAVDARAEPHVVYHGTAQSAVKSILKAGLQPSFGMLGTAVYTGSFWKAFRFATLTQDYLRRPGAIMRIYAFWALPLVKSLEFSDRCRCTRCAGPPDAIAKLCDHNGVWSRMANAVLAYPVPGGPIKNEEYATTSPATLLIESVAHAEATTDHHEPFNRAVTVL